MGRDRVTAGELRAGPSPAQRPPPLLLLSPAQGSPPNSLGASRPFHTVKIQWLARARSGAQGHHHSGEEGRPGGAATCLPPPPRGSGGPGPDGGRGARVLEDQEGKENENDVGEKERNVEAL